MRVALLGGGALKYGIDIAAEPAGGRPWIAGARIPDHRRGFLRPP